MHQSAYSTSMITKDKTPAQKITAVSRNQHKSNLSVNSTKVKTATVQKPKTSRRL